MAGRLSSTSLEAREALRREAARERAQQKGLAGGIGAVGPGGQGPPVFRAQRCPPTHQAGGGVQAGTPQGLFGAPVKLEEEDETSRRLKTVLGDYKSIQGSPMAAGPPPTANASHPAHGQTSSQGSAAAVPLQPSAAHSHGQQQPLQTQHQHSQQPPASTASQQEQPAQLPRRSQQVASVPRTDSRSARQANGVASPRRQASKAVTGVNTHGAVAPAPVKANPPLVTPGQRKCHQSEQSGRGSAGHNPSIVDQQGGVGPKGRGGSLGHGVAKNGGSHRYLTPPDNSILGATPVNNSSAPATSIPTAVGKDLAVRVEEVLREMKVPPLLPLIDDGGSIERPRDLEWDREKLDGRVVQADSREARTDHPTSLLPHHNPVSQTALPVVPPIRPFSTLSSPQLAELAAAGEIALVEAPPNAHSPVRSPSPYNGHGPNSLPASVTPSVMLQQPQPQNLVPSSSVNSTTVTARSGAVPAVAEIDGGPRGGVPVVSNLSSPGSSSDSDDDDDRESISQEDSQDSDVEQNKSMRMTSCVTQFATTDKFSEKISPFGELAGTAPSSGGIFSQQRPPHATQQLPAGRPAIGSATQPSQLTTPTLQITPVPPHSAAGDASRIQSIESPNSASDDALAEERGSSWGLRALISSATPNSAASASSLKSPAKSSPRRSPTPLEGTPRKGGKTQTPNRALPASERQHRKRNRAPSAGSDARSKESSLEPPSSVEKRRSAPSSDQKSAPQLNSAATTAAIRGVAQQLQLQASARSSVTPEPDHNSNSSPLVKNHGVSGGKREAQLSRVASPLVHHNTDSNSSLADVERRRERADGSGVAEGGRRRKRPASTRAGEDDLGLVVKIPFSRLKRRPGQLQSQQLSNAKCDSGSVSNGGSGNGVGNGGAAGGVVGGVAVGVASSGLPAATIAGSKDERVDRLDGAKAAASGPGQGGVNTARSRDAHSGSDPAKANATKDGGAHGTPAGIPPVPQPRSREDRRAESPMSIDSASSCCSTSATANNSNISGSNNSSKNRRRPHGSDADERGSRRKDDEKRKKEKKDKGQKVADSNGSRADKAEKSAEKGEASVVKDKERERAEKRDVKREEKRKDHERLKAESKEDLRKDTKEDKADRGDKAGSKSKADDATTASKKEKSSASATKDSVPGAKPAPDPSSNKVKDEKKDPAPAEVPKAKDDAKRKSDETSRKSDETSRKSDETSRKSDETSRKTEETPRKSEETSRKSDESSASSTTSTSLTKNASAAKEHPKDKWVRNKMLSDACERMEREARISAPDLFIAEAKKLKHAGDNERTPSGQVKKYLESALCFMLGGNLIEVMANRTDGSRQAQKMYQDTHALVRHVCGRLHKSIPQGGAGVQESRLTVLSLRVQAVLSHRIYLIMSRDRERSTAALHEFQSLNLAKLASGYEGSAVSNGATASPAGSHSSASSGVLLTSGSGRDNGVPGSAPGSQGCSGQPVRSYTLPAGLVENVQKAVHRMIYLQRAFDLWNQSGNYMVETNNKEFFDAAASAACSSGYVDLFTPTSEFVKFARETIFRIDELTNVS